MATRSIFGRRARPQMSSPIQSPSGSKWTQVVHDLSHVSILFRKNGIERDILGILGIRVCMMWHCVTFHKNVRLRKHCRRPELTSAWHVCRLSGPWLHMTSPVGSKNLYVSVHIYIYHDILTMISDILGSFIGFILVMTVHHWSILVLWHSSFCADWGVALDPWYFYWRVLIFSRQVSDTDVHHGFRSCSFVQPRTCKRYGILWKEPDGLEHDRYSLHLLSVFSDCGERLSVCFWRSHARLGRSAALCILKTSAWCLSLELRPTLKVRTTVSTDGRSSEGAVDLCCLQTFVHLQYIYIYII